MAKNNRFRRLLLALFLGLGLLVSLLGVYPGQAASLPVPACNPFNADGTVKSTRDCECSQLKTDANYCLDPTEYLQLKVSQNVGAALLSAAEKFTGLLWFLDRLAVNFAQFALSGTVWTQIRETLLAMLANILGGSGGVLDLIIRGPNGLFYLALILAGIIMIVPFAVFGQRPVKIERVFLWGVFIIALFIGSTQGFDLIGAIEQLRVNLMQTVLSGETVDLSALVGAPMRATSTEATLIEEGQPLALPAAFADAYFPGVDTLDTWRFRVRVPTPLNNILDVVFPGVLYEDDALKDASNQAMGGALLALLSLLPAAILLLTGAVLMLLTAASLVLIIFFVAAIPLGFFEFGATILGGIARQYMGIVLLSLFTAIFIRILAGLGVGIFGNDFSLSGMVVYVGGLGLVFVALQAALRQAWKALDGSAGMVQNAFTPVFASAGNLPYTSGPVSGAMESGQNTLNSAVQTASMLAMGAATGGGSLLAAIPGLLTGGGSAPGSPPPSGDLQAVASAFPATAASGVFAPAPSGGPTSPSGGAGAGSGTASAPTPVPSPPPPSATPPTSHAHDRQVPVNPPGTRPFAPAHDPAYLTPDLQGLKDAEHAYFDAGDQVAARRLLAQGLGSNALADAMLDVYRTEGRSGAEKARQVVAQAQDTATRLPISPVAHGAFTPAYMTALQDAGRQAGLTGTPLFEELTQASARQMMPISFLSSAERTELLAYAVAAPDDPLMVVEDAAAQFRLHDLSEKMGWEADKLKALFAHYDQALREAKRAGQPVAATLTQRLHADPAFAQDSEATRQEAARLAVLVAEKTWIQLPTEAPASGPPPSPSSSAPPSQPPGPAPVSPVPSAPPVPPPPPVASPANPGPVGFSPAPASPSPAAVPVVSPAPGDPVLAEEAPVSSVPPAAVPVVFAAPGNPVPTEEAPVSPAPPTAVPVVSPAPGDPAPAEEAPVSPVPPAAVPVVSTAPGDPVPAEEAPVSPVPPAAVPVVSPAPGDPAPAEEAPVSPVPPAAVPVVSAVPGNPVPAEEAPVSPVPPAAVPVVSPAPGDPVLAEEAPVSPVPPAAVPVVSPARDDPAPAEDVPASLPMELADPEPRPFDEPRPPEAPQASSVSEGLTPVSSEESPSETSDEDEADLLWSLLNEAVAPPASAPPVSPPLPVSTPVPVPSTPVPPTPASPPPAVPVAVQPVPPSHPKES